MSDIFSRAIVASHERKVARRRLPSAVVFWNGLSTFNATGVMGVLQTSDSHNSKIGNPLQTWYLPRSVSPVNMGEEESAGICGDCPHQHVRGGACYVVRHNAPRSIYAGLERRGELPDKWFSYVEHLSEVQLATLGDLLQARGVRIGAFGDPLSIPALAHAGIERVPDVWGYTRAWRREPNHPLKGHIMASVESAAGYEEAHDLGWRTFRIKKPGGPLLKGEVLCPSERVNCDRCGLCSGGRRDALSIAIDAHGVRAKRFTEGRQDVAPIHG